MKKYIIRSGRSGIIFILGIISITCSSFCAETSGKSIGDIKMDKMIVHNREGYIELLENVVLKIDGAVIKADKAIIFMSKKGDKEKKKKKKEGSGKDNFSKMVATGNVRIKHPDGTVVGERAVWIKGKDTIRLTGNPGVEAIGGETIYADAIIYNLVTKRCSFVGRPSGKGSVKSSDKSSLF